MARIQTYRDLAVWQKGIELVREVYCLTRSFPRTEQFGLCGQMQRAAVSVPSNIAEGHARQHTSEFRQFLCVARGSLAELDTQLMLSVELGYATPSDAGRVGENLVELRKMINGLIRKLPAPR